MSEFKKLKISLKTNVVTRETYFSNGRIHRDSKDGPAEIGRDEDTGLVLWEIYKWRGQRHREDGPAEIDLDARGRVTKETYWVRNTRHRDPKEGPAERSFAYKNDVPIETEYAYFVNNVLYRDPSEGPCNVIRDPETGREVVDFSSKSEEPGRPVRTRRLRGRPIRLENS